MSTDNNSPTMNGKIAHATLKRYYANEGIAPSGQKIKTSGINTLVNLDILKHFAEPHVMFEKFRTATFTRKGVVKPYKHTSKMNWSKALSKIAQHLTDEEKVKIMDDFYHQQSLKGDHNTRFKKMRQSNADKIEAFKFYILKEYTAWNGGNLMEYNEDNVNQQMNERQTAAYQPRDQLLKKLLDLNTAYDTKGSNTARDVYDRQFVVAGLIYLLADRNRRLDIANTMLADGEGVNVVLREDGIFIKKTEKTKEPNVLLPFTDERLISAVKTLVDIRKANNKDRLFLLENGDVPKTTKHTNPKKWFAEAFKKVMKKLGVGENLTMGVFRMAYGIHLSQQHDNTLINEKRIEDQMGHRWDIHQRRYNLTALENGADVDAASDDEE